MSSDNKAPLYRIVELLDPRIWSDVEIDRPLFDVHPPILRFHNIVPYRIYSRVVQLRNIDKVRLDRKRERHAFDV